MRLSGWDHRDDIFYLMCREGPNCSSFVICRVFCDYEPIKHPPTMAKPKQTRGPHQMPLKGPGHGWILSVQSHFSGVCFDLKFSLCHLGVSHLFLYVRTTRTGPGPPCSLHYHVDKISAEGLDRCGLRRWPTCSPSFIHYPLAIHPSSGAIKTL